MDQRRADRQRETWREIIRAGNASEDCIRTRPPHSDCILILPRGRGSNTKNTASLKKKQKNGGKGKKKMDGKVGRDSNLAAMQGNIQSASAYYIAIPRGAICFNN